MRRLTTQVPFSLSEMLVAELKCYLDPINNRSLVQHIGNADALTRQVRTAVPRAEYAPVPLSAARARAVLYSGVADRR
jgi:hypothetical protein